MKTKITMIEVSYKKTDQAGYWHLATLVYSTCQIINTAIVIIGTLLWWQYSCHILGMDFRIILAIIILFRIRSYMSTNTQVTCFKNKMWSVKDLKLTIW